MPKFTYLWIEFEGYRDFTKKDWDFYKVSRSLTHCQWLTPEKRNFKEFYDLATKEKCFFDLYKIDWKIVCPGINYLFYYTFENGKNKK